jgi:hypothetical protein
MVGLSLLAEVVERAVRMAPPLGLGHLDPALLAHCHHALYCGMNTLPHVPFPTDGSIHIAEHAPIPVNQPPANIGTEVSGATP